MRLEIKRAVLPVERLNQGTSWTLHKYSQSLR